jgi:hypothetical protein
MTPAIKRRQAAGSLGTADGKASFSANRAASREEQAADASKTRTIF